LPSVFFTMKGDLVGSLRLLGCKSVRLPVLTVSKLIVFDYMRGSRGMNEAGEHIVVGESQHGGQSGASSNEARDDSEDNDSALISALSRKT